jgi:hypothetical protein
MDNDDIGRTEPGLAWDAGYLVNDTMNVLQIGNKPAIAREDDLLKHALDVAEDMVNGKIRAEIGQRSIENAILLADANQAELLADFDVLRRGAFYRRLRAYIEGIKKATILRVVELR